VNQSGVLYEPPGIPCSGRGGCQDCHSTSPPFSTWDSDDGEAGDGAEAVAEGSMPPRRFLLVHPDANLSDAERQVLVDALEAMDRARRGGGGGDRDRGGPGGGG
jgi:hypothetical protein